MLASSKSHHVDSKRAKLQALATTLPLYGARQMCGQLAMMIGIPVSWYMREITIALLNGYVHWIPNRADTDLYLARFWITKPAEDRETDGSGFESGDQLLLHWFNSGDDDKALHCHPWDFATTILQGGYKEHLPPLEWCGGTADSGPAWDQRIVTRGIGESIGHCAADLHCVGTVLPNTVTLVRTGPRYRAWGFHPPGRPWMPWRDFIDQPRTARHSRPSKS